MTASIADLEARLTSVEKRLAALDGKAAAESDHDLEAAAPTLGEGYAASASKHIGHVLLIFGGAYLLRAVTEFEFLPTAIGLLLGAAYAIFWLFMAYRKGGLESQHTNAAFFGATSVVLTLPLVHEATTTFALLSGAQGVIALGIYCVVAILVAALHNLRTLAWLVTAGGIAAGMASLVVTHAAIPVAIFLLLLGLVSLWVVYWRNWMGLCWLGALGANLGVIALVALAGTDRWPIDPRLPFVFAVTLLTTYLLSFTFQSHIRGQLVSFFEVAQALVAGSIVLTSAVLATRGGYLDISTIGIMGVVLGCGGYGLAIAKHTRDLRYTNFFYYSAFGLVFLLVGTGLLIPLAWAAVFWALLGMLMAWFSGRKGWVSLSLQCTFLLVAAGAGSGLLSSGLEALIGDPSNGWAVLKPTHIVVAVATVACLFIPVAQHSDRWGVLAGLPQLVVLALSVWGVGGLIVAVSAQQLAGAGGMEPNLAVLAAIRTAVLSAASVILALSSRHWRWPEARWLVYPVLILVGIKLFIEDYPNGQPASLFVALGFVGTALLLVAPILKREPTPSQ
ncbi:MAG: hypothetical protein OES59_01155 [Gammaproteobacteria bacterium]|nr:hypothetical protein [Gammaproteobacteria bacterium]